MGRIIAATAAVLTAVTAVTAVGASTEWFGLASMNRSHLSESSRVEAPITVEGSGLRLALDGISHGGNPIYLNLTLTREDGGAVHTPIEGARLAGVYFETAHAELADGTQTKLHILLLEDSTTYEYRLEAMLFLTDDMSAAFGSQAKIVLGNPLTVYEFEDGTHTKLAEGLEIPPLTVELPKRESRVCCEIEPIAFECDGASIELGRLELDVSTLEVYGSITPEVAMLPSLKPIIDSAVLLTRDGERIPCGTKNGCGTTADGEFALTWLLATEISPDEIAAIEIGGEVSRVG